MGCDPSMYIFSCALCHESTFDNIFIFIMKSTLFTNFAPWRKMKPWEFGLADGAYRGRPDVVALARRPPSKEFGRTASTYNDTHAFFRSRVEHLYAIFWTFAIVRAPWHGHGEVGMEKFFQRMKVLINLVAFQALVPSSVQPRAQAHLKTTMWRTPLLHLMVRSVLIVTIP